MRTFLVVTLMFGLVGVAAAKDLGNQAPVKAPQSYPENLPNPQRQGGDTIATALAIPSLPYNDTGTTAGFTNDYDETCPVGASLSPDVVYRYEPSASAPVTIDLCGSNYDTKVYIYNSALYLIACNDDFYFDEPCGVWVSKLENVWLAAGDTYYIIIDGYTGAYGDYVLAVEGIELCVIDCPVGGEPENEPPLVPGYIDIWNGGCNTLPGIPFQSIVADDIGQRIFCGVSGWYSSEGSPYRDTDWFILTMGPGGAIEITVDAEFATYIFELSPQDCASVGVLQQASGGPCAEATMSIGGYAGGAPVWFWVGPTVFYPAPGGPHSYDYVVWFTGLEPAAIAIEPATWGTVKALFE